MFFPQSEQQLQKAIIAYLNNHRWRAWRNNSGVVRQAYVSRKTGQMSNRMWRAGVKGSSDIFAIQPPVGRFWAIECKYGDNKPTIHQKIFLEQIREAGGVGIVVWSIEELVMYLNKYSEGGYTV